MSADPLITVALLGCTRSPQMPAAPDDRLASTWEPLAAGGPEEVLQALALTGSMLKAGVMTALETGEPEPGVIETQADLSPAAVDSLMRLLSGEWEEFLPEWMELAALTGSLVPGRAVPDLLRAANRRRGLRPLISRLTGQRGQRLARRHSEFSWLLLHGETADDAWDSDRPEERLAWFSLMRREDPDRAREAMSGQWAGEEGSMRESLARIIATSPLKGDEAWLESVGMKDRRQEVREQVLVALGQLDGSAFRERAASRATAILRSEKRLFKKVLSLNPPTEHAPHWAGDGVKEKPPVGTGEKAWWARQIISLIPLCDWPGMLGCKEEELFSMPLDPDWAEVIVLGWIDSAMRWPAKAMPERLIPMILELKNFPAAGPRHVIISKLLETMEPLPRHRMLDLLGPQMEDPEFVALLTCKPEPPPPGAGSVALAILDRLFLGGGNVIERHQARLLARCVPYPEIPTRLIAMSRLPDLTPAAEEFARALEFRQALFLQLTSSPT